MDNHELSDREYNRLKDLVDAGKRYHYRNFLFSVILLVLLVKSESESLKLILDIELPVKYIMLVLYLLTVVNTIVTLDVMVAIWKPISSTFSNEIPFNWFALTGKKTKILAGFWIMLPFILCSIAVALSKLSIPKVALIYIGFMSIFLPNYLKEHFYKISKMVDENGIPITFSIYLLYWLRLLRVIFVLILLAFIISPYISTSSTIIEILTRYYFLILLIVLMIVLRIIGTFAHKHIDKLGVKLGFANEYKKL